MSSSTLTYDCSITTDSLTSHHSHAAFLSGFITAVPFIVRQIALEHYNLTLLFKTLTITKLKAKITKLKLHFNCYKKHTLTHLSLVIKTASATFDLPITIVPLQLLLLCYHKKTPLCMLKILQKAHLMSYKECLSKMHIWLRNCAPSV